MNEYIVSALEIGSYFDEPLYLKDGTVLAPSGQILTKVEIDRLIRWKIEKVYTTGALHKPEQEGAEDGEPAPDKTAAAPEPKQETSDSQKEKPQPPEKKPEISDAQKRKRFERVCFYKNNAIKNYDEALEKTKTLLENMAIGGRVEKKSVDEIVRTLIENVPKGKNFYVACVLAKSTPDYIFSHCLNVAILSLIMALSLNYDSPKLYEITAAGLIHDVGMLKIPKNIREKDRKLQEKEFNLIKAHPIHGYKIITKYSHIFSASISTAILQHHESFDGDGYPQNLNNEKITEYAKILSIVDSYEALTKKRSYREEYLGYEAIKNLLLESSKRYDPVLLKKFLANISIYPIGSIVQLKNNNYGIVISANKKIPLRPMIKVIFDESKKRLPEYEITDLSVDKNASIKRIVPKNEFSISILDEF